MLEIEENRLENAKVKEGAVKCVRVVYIKKREGERERYSVDTEME